MNWFILYVRTSSEERVLNLLKKCLDVETYTPFIPKKVYPRVKTGIVQGKELKPCFPGYVFIRSTGNINDSIQNIILAASAIKEAYFFLCYGDDKKNIALHENEKNYIERLLNAEFCMDASVGFIEGDKVRIISGALIGLESQIIKINKQKRTAIIELDMFGGRKQITLMLEIIEKTLNV